MKTLSDVYNEMITNRKAADALDKFTYDVLFDTEYIEELRQCHRIIYDDFVEICKQLISLKNN